MKYKDVCDISRISRICGLLEAVAHMRGATITDSLAIEMECAAENLYLYIIGQIKKGVNAHEGPEESPPSPQPADQ